MLKNIPPYPGDPILGLNEQFQKDTRAYKVNLAIGIYFDADGCIPTLDCVQKAESQILQEALSKSYLPIEGLPLFNQAVQQLIFGADHEVIQSKRVATLQTVGSSAALKVAADFAMRWLTEKSIWVSDPTWDNHRALFEGSGLRVNTYPYDDPNGGALRCDAMLQALSNAPKGSLVLLHACCHNPTGQELNQEQWQALIPVFKARELLPFLDMAYQGYGEGIAADAFAPRALADSALPFWVANSFSKSMSLYGERAGALSVVCADETQAQCVLGQMKATVRRIYSSPPLHAAQIVSKVLTQANLRASWEKDVTAMRQRIQAMRQQLHAEVLRQAPHLKMNYLLEQRGMFSYTRLCPQQVDRLRDEFAIYLLQSGRMCLTGLNPRNCKTVASALVQVMTAA
jgi:aromatic-amino-acid transaminase